MKKRLLSPILLLASVNLIASLAHGQSEPPAENLMADEIFGEGPSEPAPALDAGSEPTPPVGTPEEKAIDLRPAEPVAAAPEKNEAFDRLDALKMSPAELIAFMKTGSMKSRVLKGQ